MAQQSVLVFARVFFICILAHEISGLKCYVCNSNEDAECLNFPPPGKFLVECESQKAKMDVKKDKNNGQNATNLDLESKSSLKISKELQPLMTGGLNYTFCRKNRVVIPRQENGKSVKPKTEVVVRSCGWISTRGHSKASCVWLPGDNEPYVTCTCQTEGCNAGHHGIPNPLLLLFLVTFTRNLININE